jgi:predicted alpha/beta hydrolase
MSSMCAICREREADEEALLCWRCYKKGQRDDPDLIKREWRRWHRRNRRERER